MESTMMNNNASNNNGGGGGGGVFHQQSPSVRSKALTLLFAACLCALSLFLSTNDASSLVDVESIEDGRIMREGVDAEEAEKESEVDKFGFDHEKAEEEEEEEEDKENESLLPTLPLSSSSSSSLTTFAEVFPMWADAESDENLTPQDIDYENANKKIALVGNGRGVLKSRKGDRVDNEHDIVGRFNFFVTKGYERDVGRRLDLWFLNKLKLPGNARFRGSTTTGKSKMNLKVKPTMGYYIPVAFEVSPQCQKKRGPGAKTCVPTSKNKRAIESEKRVLTRAYARFKIHPDFVPEVYQRILHVKYDFRHRFPSTGILALVYCLERFPNSTVSLHGFDFVGETPKIGHYWEKIFKLRTVHSLKLEKQFVGKLIQTGRVKIL